jgi:serine phosphatase RsbU (regulator of sigma subunit)
MCKRCAGKIAQGRHNLIAQWKEGLKAFAKQLPQEIQAEVLNAILGQLVDTLNSTQPKELPACTIDDACEILHDYGHIMARKGYTIDEVLKRFALLQDILWDFLSAFLRNEVYPAGREERELLIDEHGSCHNKINLFFRDITGAISRAYVEEKENIILEKEAELKAKELEIAGTIMKALLPLDMPVIEGIDLEGRVVSADVVGGDFWEASRNASGNLEIVLGDVMGHGIPAALLVSMIKYLHMAYRGNAMSMSKKMEKVNTIILRDTPPEVFIASLYAMLDFEKKKLFYISAGHPPPLLLRDGKLRELGESDVPLGLVEKPAFHTHSLNMKNKDILLLLSDGVLGARNEKREFLGLERIRDFLTSESALSARELCDGIIEKTQHFCAYGRCDDDITIVAIKILDLDAAGVHCA